MMLTFSNDEARLFYSKTGDASLDEVMTRDDLNSKQDTLADTNWQTVTFATGYSRYDTTYDTVQCRKFGKVVEIRGVWKPTANKSASISAVKFASLPTGFAPSSDIRVLQPGSDKNTYWLTIGTNGNLSWSRYGTTSSAQLPSGAFCQCYVTYLI